MRLILVRHGRTTWNERQVFRGRADVPLDETGIRQAHAAAGRVASYAVGTIFSSPLQRAWETARIIAEKTGIAPEMDNNLLDIDFGDWEGRPLAEVQSKFPQHYEQWLNAPHKAKIPNGEDLDLVRRRAVAVLDRSTQDWHADIVVVSHRVVLKVLICTALGRDLSGFWQVKQDVAAISVLDYRDGKFDLSLLNDTGHLDANGPAGKPADF